MAGASVRTQLKGNTLRVYLYLVKSGTSELRDIQRDLGFSTPSLASYHIGRLMEAGCVFQNQYGRYSATGDATHELLAGYSKLGALVVPELFFFSVLFTAVTGFFAVMSFLYVQYLPLLAGTAVAAVVVLWYQTMKLWRRLASWK